MIYLVQEQGSGKLFLKPPTFTTYHLISYHSLSSGGFILFNKGDNMSKEELIEEIIQKWVELGIIVLK